MKRSRGGVKSSDLVISAVLVFGMVLCLELITNKELREWFLALL